MSFGQGENASSSGAGKSVTTAPPSTLPRPRRSAASAPAISQLTAPRTPTSLEIARSSATGTPCRDAASATPNPSIASAYPPRAASSAARASLPVTVETVSTGPRFAPGIPSGAATTSPLPKPSADRPRKPSGDSAPRSAATISVASTTSPGAARPGETAARSRRSPQARSRPARGSARWRPPPRPLPGPTPPARIVAPGPHSASYGPTSTRSSACQSVSHGVALDVHRGHDQQRSFPARSQTGRHYRVG